MGQGKKSEDNVVAVIYKAVRHYRIRVSITSIREYLQRHPYYPSLKSVCDAFTRWNIDYYPLKLTGDEIKSLKMPYIAHRNIAGGQLVFATNNKNNTVNYTTGANKVITEDTSNFLKGLSGAVIVYQPAEGSGEKEFRHNRQNEILNKLLIPFSLVMCLVVLIGVIPGNQIYIDSARNWRFWSILFTKTFGLITSLFLVQQELKIKNPFTDKICHLTEKTNCNAVLESGSSSFFGWIGWADIGFIYFAGGLIYTLLSSEAYSTGILLLLSILVIPYPFYSIYLQAFRLNKFCPLCLAVQITLVTEFIILLPVIHELTFDFIHVTIFLSVYLLTLVIYVLIREIINLRINLGSKTDRFNRFKRNPIIFRYLFIEGYIDDLKIPDCLVAGNPKSKVVVHAFLSLYCQPCVKAFRSLNYLYENCNGLKINIILTGNPNTKELSLIKLCKDLSIEQSTDKLMGVLSEWYRNLENRNRMQLPEIKSSDLQASKEILNVNKELFKKNKISGTPTILINNHKYPGQYEISDLEYYIDDIVELLEKKKARSPHPF